MTDLSSSIPVAAFVERVAQAIFNENTPEAQALAALAALEPGDILPAGVVKAAG